MGACCLCPLATPRICIMTFASVRLTEIDAAVTVITRLAAELAATKRSRDVEGALYAEYRVKVEGHRSAWTEAEREEAAFKELERELVQVEGLESESKMW